MGKKVFVRTDLAPTKHGLIWLPPTQDSTYGSKFASVVPVTATVLDVGPHVRAGLNLPVGERVLFWRLAFGWTHKLADGTFVGWVSVDDIIGHPEAGEARSFEQE